MKPVHSILDGSSLYVPAIATWVVETRRRFGWRPTTEEERKRRRRSTVTLVGESRWLRSGPYGFEVIGNRLASADIQVRSLDIGATRVAPTLSSNGFTLEKEQ
jgi:hypothetical protein